MCKKIKIFLVVLFVGPLVLWGQGTIPSTGGSVAGTTVGQGDDCDIRSTSDYYYSFTPEEDDCNSSSYTVSLCNTTSGWDSFMYLYDGVDCSSSTILASNDDACGLLSEITYAFTAGVTYYIYIEGFSADGNYQLDVFPSLLAPVLSDDFWLLGGATTSSEEDCYFLTENTMAQVSCTWGSTSADFSIPFSEQFIINLGSDDSGADGMAFVYHNDPRAYCACATGGQSLSYGGGGAISNSLIFEIDTYINTDDRDDFSFPCIAGSCSDPDHSAIHINGIWQNPVFDAVPLMDGALEYNIENGLDHLLSIDWDGSTIVFTISDLSESTTYVVLSYAFDPLVLFGTNEPLFGFTGSTGALFNQQSFCLVPTCVGAPEFIKN